MRSWKLIALLAIPAQLAVAQSASTTKNALSLDDAINIARQNNPQLLQTKNLVRDADAQVRTAYGALLPNVSANLGSTYTAGGAQFVNGVSIGSNSASTYSSNYRIGVSYSLTAAVAYAPRAARANRAAGDANVVSASEILRSNVTTQYIQALEQQATAALNDTLVQTAQGQLDLANAKMKVGAGTVLDVRTAEVALGQAQVAALQAHNQARIEKLKLFQLLGVAPDTSAQLTTQFSVTTPPASLDSLLTLARRANPDLAAKKATQYANQMQVRVAQSSYLPSLFLSTGLGAQAFGFSSIDPILAGEEAQFATSGFANCLSTDSLRVGAGLPSLGCSPTLSQSAIAAERARLLSTNHPFQFNSAPLSFSASLSLPIFNNFQREANIEQARVSRDNATYDTKARELQLTTDVTTDYLNLVTAQQTVELQNKIAAQATEALAFADESYKVGAKTFLDVTTARGQYEQALVARSNAVYDYHKAYAALENAVGRPLR